MNLFPTGMWHDSSYGLDLSKSKKTTVGMGKLIIICSDNNYFFLCIE